MPENVRSVALTIAGNLAFYLRPSLANVWGGPFNGQCIRQAIVEQLVGTVGFTACVETGTYRGSTTEYLSTRFALPVYSVEHDPLWFGYAKTRLRKCANVDLRYGDSREFLDRLSMQAQFTPQRVFFYLDAHWNEDLPLGKEVGIILSRWSEAVVMIDDFQVPDDPGYGYDDYGPEQALTFAYLEKCCPLPCAAFLPAAGAQIESGSKRGCVILCRNGPIIEQMSAMKLLRRWPEGPWGAYA